jgi:hypothetical protein
MNPESWNIFDLRLSCDGRQRCAKMTAGIGHSVLQDDALQYGVSSPLTIPPPAPCTAARPPQWTHRGLWRHHVDEVAVPGAGRRILLSGDESLESMQILDSLTMDLALSLASNQPCRCRLRRRHRTGQVLEDDEATSRVDCDGCVAVVIIMPYSTETAVEEEMFPLLCHCATMNRVANDANPEDDSLAPKNSVLPGTADGGTAGNICHPTADQLLNLRRIQIRRVAGLAEVWHYLLALPGVPAEQHPVGGILLHGLNRILASSSGTASATAAAAPPFMDAAVATIRQTQVGAYIHSLCAVEKGWTNTHNTDHATATRAHVVVFPSTTSL